MDQNQNGLQMISIKNYPMGGLVPPPPPHPSISTRWFFVMFLQSRREECRKVSNNFKFYNFQPYTPNLTLIHGILTDRWIDRDRDRERQRQAQRQMYLRQRHVRQRHRNVRQRQKNVSKRQRNVRQRNVRQRQRHWRQRQRYVKKRQKRER